MQIKITKPGLFGRDGEIPVGTTIKVKGEPKGWAGRYEIVGGSGKTPVMNVDDDAEEKTRLAADLEAAGVKVDGRWSLDRLKEEYAKATA